LVVVCLVLLTVGIGRSPAGAAIGYFANYARIGGLDLGLLTHTWFVAVMAHFYLLWPLVIGVTPARHRVRTVAVLALAAVAWRAIAIVALSPGWVYNATDTNAAALLAGCYLGVARPLTSRFAGWSIPGLLGLMFLPVFGEEGAAFLWGGFVALALGVLAIQHAVTRPAWLETPVLVWLGTTSYGLYLWHYVFVRSEISLWAAIPLTMVMGAASWYLLEKPVLRWSVRLDPRTARSEPAAPIRTGHSVPASANRQVASGGRWSTG
jgi:peptidoglycan/LPS O-acetylase OafA/YrhL